MSSYKIATIPGDGIGKEVIPEGIRMLDAAGRKHDIKFAWDMFDWSCETYKETGQMMPDDGIDQTREHDAIYLGAVGFPGVPDHVSLWGLLIPYRREYHQYVNLRPVRLFDGVPSPLANRKPGDIDSMSSAKTSKVNIPRLAAGFMAAPMMRWLPSKLSSPGAVLTAF